MKLLALHFSSDPTPVGVRIHPINGAAADISIGEVDHTVFRPTTPELRAWLTNLRDKIDAALAAPEPVPQQTSSHDAADAAGGAPPPADAAGSADTDAAVLP